MNTAAQMKALHICLELTVVKRQNKICAIIYRAHFFILSVLGFCF